MPAPDGIESTTLGQRLVLLALVELNDCGETPANPIDVNARCSTHVGEVDAEVLAEPSEVEVTRALNELAAGDLVAETQAGRRSAVGKGRPSYSVRVDRERVLDELAGDGRVAGVVERIRGA